MATAEEKVEKPLHIESRIDPRYDLTVLTTEDAEFLASFSEDDRKRIIWKAGHLQKTLNAQLQTDSILFRPGRSSTYTNVDCALPHIVSRSFQHRFVLLRIATWKSEIPIHDRKCKD